MAGGLANKIHARHHSIKRRNKQKTKTESEELIQKIQAIDAELENLKKKEVKQAQPKEKEDPLSK